MPSGYPGLYKHPKTGVFWIKRRVPKQVSGVRGSHVYSQTLATKDRRTAEALYLERMRDLAKLWLTLSEPEAKLVPRRLAALAGEFYRATIEPYADDPGEPERWRDEASRLKARNQPLKGRIMNAYGSAVSEEMVAFLNGRGLRHAAEDYRKLCRAFFDAKVAAFVSLERMAAGDFSPDPAAKQFPAYVPDAAPPTCGHALPRDPRAPVLSVDKDWNAYVEGRGLSEGTRKRYRPLLVSLAEHLGDVDLARASGKDIRAWLDSLSAPDGSGKKRSFKTVSDAYLAAARSFYAWAVDKLYLDENPCDGIKLTKPLVTETSLEENGFTKEEALLILSETLRSPDPRMSAYMAAARRWVPWLCAYTGARVNELTQLRACDVTQRTVKNRLVWVMTITPEAGTVKDRKPREVPLHEHLVEQGFDRFVQSRGRGPLFYDPARSGGSSQNPTYRKVGDKLAAWVREIGVDRPGVAPNHGWRHAFSTAARDVLMREETRRAILGHVGLDVDDKYGHHTLEAKVRQIKRMRRFVVAEPTEPRTATAASKKRSETRIATAKRAKARVVATVATRSEVAAPPQESRIHAEETVTLAKASSVPSEDWFRHDVGPEDEPYAEVSIFKRRSGPGRLSR